MKIVLAADHAGFTLKEHLRDHLVSEGYEIIDKGAFSFDPTDDYTDFIFPAVMSVANGEAERGIIVGSSGQGEGIAANRIPGIRALVYYGKGDSLPHTSKTGEQKDIVESSRTDNDSNVLSLGASFVNQEEAKEVITRWLAIPFSQEERHVRRISKLDKNL